MLTYEDSAGVLPKTVGTIAGGELGETDDLGVSEGGDVQTWGYAAYHSRLGQDIYSWLWLFVSDRTMRGYWDFSCIVR